jgi:DNA-binding transcriptional LysR family regulator
VLPGPTALTVIRRAANSRAATRVTWSINAFAPEYSELPGTAELVTPEAMLITRPPSDSTPIGKLERKLGVRLLDRTSRRVLLTPAGAMLLAEGRTAVENLGAVVQRVRRQAAPGELLTVVVKAGDGTGLVRQIARQCAADPQVPEVRIMFSRAGDITAAVRGGVADAAILRAPFDSRGLDTEVLLAEPRVAALPADHRLAGRREIRRADLAGEPMPRWADPAATAALAFWTGTDTVMAAWPEGSKSPAIARFLRTAAEVAASHGSRSRKSPH